MKSAYIFLAILVLVNSSSVFADDPQERIQLKSRETQDHWVALPAGVVVFSTQKEKDLMPGNDSFGFFYRADNEKNGICRLRVKVVCDYGMELLKEQKNIPVKVQFSRIYYNTKTDLEGIADLMFRCDSQRQNNGVIVTARKHMESSKLSEFPKELRIPADDCK